MEETRRVTVFVSISEIVSIKVLSQYMHIHSGSNDTLVFMERRLQQK